MTTDDWNAQTYADNVAFVPELGKPVLELLAPQPTETILDLGCGDGALTANLVARAGRVVGIDGSPAMVAAACELGIDARVVDGAQIAAAIDNGELAAQEFDAVFTNAALHWIQQAADVIAGVRALLKPGGRFVGEFGAHGNIASLAIALGAARRINGHEAVTSPWFFPTVAEYTQLLQEGGFEVDSCVLTPRPTPLPTGAAGWIKTFGWPFLSDLSEAEAEVVAATAVDLLADSMCDSQGNWTADYVRLKFSATLL